jgi:hemerythrin
MAWSDEHLLGYAPMDDTHREFVALVDALLGCEDGAFLAHLEAFERHAVAHFAEEDAWMARTDFPPKDCHVDEHAAVLRSVREVLEVVRQGDIAEGRRLAAALADWFPGHAFHLDSALAHWMVKRNHGGKPVVLRRNVAGAKKAPAT